MPITRASSDHMEWVDPTTLETASDGAIVQVIKDNWWYVDAEGRIPFYVWQGNRSPQCNQQRMIVDMMISRGTQPEGAVGVVQIPLILVPVNPRDY